VPPIGQPRQGQCHARARRPDCAFGNAAAIRASTCEPPGNSCSAFEPCLDILPAAQRRLWPELSQTPEDFALYGGTTIALQLGHRPTVRLFRIAIICSE
jgi:hypothetical protein